MRAEQREATREKILTAALVAIAESGFDGVSTRAIADRAEVSQGLLTYHFKSKDALWRAAADFLFALADDVMEKALSGSALLDPLERQRVVIRKIVHFNAEHPELMRFMLDTGKNDNERSRWLVDTHLRRHYELITGVMSNTSEDDLPHAFYVLAGASGGFFNAQSECIRTTGVDPFAKAAIERHADYVAELMVPS